MSPLLDMTFWPKISLTAAMESLEDMELKGIFVPVFTPVHDNGRINLSIIPSYMEYLNKSVIDGIVVAGTTGEGVCLSVCERKDLVEAWVKVAKPLGIKVISQVGGAPLPDVIELAKQAAEVKADGILCLPELYFKPKTPEELVSYLEIVSKAANLPLIYYHFPSMSGVDVDMVEFFRLAISRIPNFIGMKCDLEVAMNVGEYITNQTMFIASHYLAPAIVMEYESSIATVNNMFPTTVRKIINSLKENDILQARALQEKLDKWVHAISSNREFLPSMKAAMQLITGIDVGPTRKPIKALTEAERQSIENNLRDLDFKIKWKRINTDFSAFK